MYDFSKLKLEAKYLSLKAISATFGGRHFQQCLNMLVIVIIIIIINNNNYYYYYYYYKDHQILNGFVVNMSWKSLRFYPCEDLFASHSSI